jgi:hypothetical protein
MGSINTTLKTARYAVMNLVRFRVTGFRSVEDSGWVDVDDVTALIGTNESGKTNLLLPLWKLNPAKDGQISPTADYPRKRYNTIRSQKDKPDYIEAVFALDPSLVTQIAGMAGCPEEHVATASVSRDFDGAYTVRFPEAAAERVVERATVASAVAEARSACATMTPGKTEGALQSAMLNAIDAATEALGDDDHVGEEVLSAMLATLNAVDQRGAPKRSSLIPVFGRLTDTLTELRDFAATPGPDDIDEVSDLVLEQMPKFVYYTHYGNLDSEIYLPHVIDNLQRTDLGSKEESKARTLKVLFEFVRLSPTEIQELGRDFKAPAHNPSLSPTDVQVGEIAERKKQRSILLQSAGNELTERFRGWWKQGEYRFRFEAFNGSSAFT